MEKFLQGRPFGHPLHTFLVHFPIGLFTLSLLLDVIDRIWPGMDDLQQSAWYSMLAGVVMALFAAIPGVADLIGIRKDHPAKKIAITHMMLNLIVVLAYVVNLVLRYNEAFDREVSDLPFLLSIGAFILLGISGHLGGKMVFDEGIGVGRHKRKTKLPRRTLKPKKDAERDGWTIVAGDRDLNDGGTLRAEVNGTVITIARWNGELFAFQEFCTPRFGPLSEGHFEGHNIVCPWHNSCFDVRSGKVTQGPAKVDLKTLEVVEQDGWIHVTPHNARISAPADSET